MKKKKRIVTIILWLAALAVLFIWSSPEQKVDRFVAKNAETLEAALYEDLSGDYSQGAGVQYTCWGQYGEHPIGEFSFARRFCTDASITAATIRPTMSRRGFQSAEVTLVPDGENCWTWRAEGDNRGMTKKIQDRWYYFEAWL